MVKISIDRYDELREYEEAYKKNQVIIVRYPSYEKEGILTPEREHFEFIKNKFKEVKEENDRLKIDHMEERDLYNEKINELQEQITKLKDRSFFQIIFG